MIPPYDDAGDLPVGIHQATWDEFRERFCIFTRSDQRLRRCQRLIQMLEEARASCVRGGLLQWSHVPSDVETPLLALTVDDMHKDTKKQRRKAEEQAAGNGQLSLRGEERHNVLVV